MSAADKNTAEPEIKLLIAVESRMDGQLFKNALERTRQRLKVTACAVSKAELTASMHSHPMDIALVSESLEDGPLTGFQVLQDLRTLSPKTRTIMLLKTENRDFVVDSFRAGAKGVFCRAESLSVLPKCIRAVHSGQIWANSKQLAQVMEALVSAAPLRTTTSKKHRVLSKREADVVASVVEGLSNREVAHRLALTEHTVSNYLFRIYEKLDISSRVELVLHSLNMNEHSK